MVLLLGLGSVVGTALCWYVMITSYQSVPFKIFLYTWLNLISMCVTWLQVPLLRAERWPQLWRRKKLADWFYFRHCCHGDCCPGVVGDAEENRSGMPPVRITIKMIDNVSGSDKYIIMQNRNKFFRFFIQVVQLFKEAGRAVSRVPFLLLQPLWVRPVRAGLITHIITRQRVCTNLVIPYWYHKCTTMIILHVHNLPKCWGWTRAVPAFIWPISVTF